MFAQPHEAGLSGKRSKRGGQEWGGGAESEATWTVTGGREARGVSSCARSAGPADRQGRETHRAQHAPTPRSGVRGGGRLSKETEATHVPAHTHACTHAHTRGRRGGTWAVPALRGQGFLSPGSAPPRTQPRSAGRRAHDPESPTSVPSPAKLALTFSF